MEIGRHKKDNHSHGEMHNFSDNETTDTEFFCQEFSKKNKKQYKTKCQEKGWKILRQWSLEIQHGSIVDPGCTKIDIDNCTE